MENPKFVKCSDCQCLILGTGFSVGYKCYRTPNTIPKAPTETTGCWMGIPKEG